MPQTSLQISVLALRFSVEPLCADKERCPRGVCVYKRERAGILMVECDGCKQWYHAKCAHLQKKEAEDWFCQRCRKSY